MGRGAWVSACLVGGAVSAAILAAPSPAPQQPERTGQPPIRTEANFVRVDVYPTADGRPVQDLAADDFELLEDGVAQRIEAFEHVVVRPAGPTARRDPNTLRESLQAAENPRSRVFVLFLDVPHVSIDSAVRIREPLVRLLDRILGADDLVGIMTPAMSAPQLVLSRKTEAIEANLRRAWPWGERFQDQLDATEMKYVSCYPRLRGCERNNGLYSDFALRMIERKRELATLEALQDLVRHLGAIREERKAILAVTEGWLLLREAPDLMKLRECGRYTEPVPGIPDLYVDPRGKLSTEDQRDPTRASKYECDSDRMRLASTDHERFFRELMDDANRANASFYPIDPRGLAVFDNPIGPATPPPPSIDRAMLTSRVDSMRTLAGNTDGMAVMNNNDLDASLKRIADDLTSYYLLGYYSTNTKLDGGFRRITVRVKRPGVNVRARRGYRAATTEEVAAARAGADTPASTPASALTTALASLARIRPEARFRVNASAVRGQPAIWVAGELLRNVSPESLRSAGAVEIEATAGTARAAISVALAPGDRGFVTALPLAWSGREPLRVRARVSSKDLGIPFTDAIEIDELHDIGRPLLFRRSPLTGNRIQPAADFQFTRNERLRLEIPVASGVTAAEGVLLDRAGQLLKIPVAVGTRADEGTGQMWIVADVTLAALAVGDYAVQVTAVRDSVEERIVTAFRLVR